MTFVRMAFFVVIALLLLSPLLHADARILLWRRKHRRISTPFLSPHNKTKIDFVSPNETTSSSLSTQRNANINISIGGGDDL
jgi:uncharacterized membrane protein